MFTTIEIDYLQFSAETRIHDEYAKSEPSTMRFYNTQEKMPSGMVCHSGNPSSSHFLFVAAGSACRNLFSEISPSQYLENILSLGAKVSRLDIAITQYIDHDGLILPRRVLEWDKRNMIVSPLAKYGASAVYKNKTESFETVYVGDWKKRGKRGIFRAYDKGSEIGLGESLLTRFEIEDKRDKAHTSAKRIASGATLPQVFRSRFDVPSDEDFQSLLNSEPMVLTRDSNADKRDEQQKNTDRWHWLITQVAPALGKAIAEDENYGAGDGNIELFLKHVNNHYNKHIT